MRQHEKQNTILRVCDCAFIASGPHGTMQLFFYFYYLRQGGYVFVVVCLFLCLLATLRKNLRTDLHEIFKDGWQWANEQIVKFWWQSGLRTGSGSVSRYW